jgi:F-type H+-transporting ATPase subunit epsilon
MAEERFHLSVLSPLGSVYDGRCISATLPTPDGEITILARHMPIVAVLAEGEARIDEGDKGHSIVLAGGFLETDLDGAVILSDFAAQSESIEVARVQAAKERAEQLLAEQKERGELALVERDLQRAILQLKVAEKQRKRRA